MPEIYVNSLFLVVKKLNLECYIATPIFRFKNAYIYS